jgi:membrane-associated phospholipid phosphatase
VKTLKKILPLFSYLFHPIFIPVYAALFYFFVNDSYYTSPEKYFALFQIVIITILLPILFFFVLRTAGQVDSIMISEISQRKIPLVIQCFLSILLVRKSITLDHFPEFHFFFLGGLMSTVVSLLLLFFKTKASLHMIAISAFTVFVIGLSIHNQTRNINGIAFLILINGIVASSRLQMKAHTPKELIIGFLLGVIPQLLLLRFWL